MIEIKVDHSWGREYEPWEGTYKIYAINVSMAAEALRGLAHGKDKVAYINALMRASIKAEVQLTEQSLANMPYKLYRLLMDKVLELNETSAEEANFTQSSPSATPP